MTASLHAQLPDYGRNIAIDGSDMPVYANGQRFVSKGGRERADSEFSDQDASWAIAARSAPGRAADSMATRLMPLSARH